MTHRKVNALDTHWFHSRTEIMERNFFLNFLQSMRGAPVETQGLLGSLICGRGQLVREQSARESGMIQ